MIEVTEVRCEGDERAREDERNQGGREKGEEKCRCVERHRVASKNAVVLQVEN